MSQVEWKEYSVQELIDLGMLEPPMDGNHGEKHPKSTDYVSEGIPFVMANDLSDGTVNLKNCYFITQEQADSLDKGFAKPGDVLLTHKATLGRTAIVPDSHVLIVLTPQVTYYRCRKGIYNRYLKYYFDSQKFQQLFQNWAGSGSTRLYLGITAQRKLPILLPPLEEQKRIAGILSSLDDKIELNNKINDNLEKQAQALFKNWFIDYAPFGGEELIDSPIEIKVPKSLKMIQVNDYPHIIETGRRPKGGAVGEGIPSIGAENVKKLGVFDYSSNKFIPREFAETLGEKGKINGYELLLYKDGGKPGTFIPHFSMFGEGYPYEEFYINEHVFKLDFGNKSLNIFAYFYFQTDYVVSWLANNGGKAAIPGINQNDVNAIWIFDLNHPKVREFGEVVKPMFEQILKNCKQNHQLSIMRDSLLPKILSGEIIV